MIDPYLNIDSKVAGMFKKILIPLDGSDNSEKIGNWATGVARALGAEISLLAVVDPDQFKRPSRDVRRQRQARDGDSLDEPMDAAAETGTDSTGTPTLIDKTQESAVLESSSGEKIIEEAVFRAKRYLQNQADKLISPGLPVSTHVVVGDPVDEIVNRITEIDADMVAMATHRGSMIARGVLGSVTDRVLRSSSVPVLTVRPGELEEFVGNAGAPNVLVVPLDGSEMSEQAIAPAIEIAVDSGAEIVFVEAIQQLAGSGIDYYYSGTEEREESLEYLQGFARMAANDGVRASIEVVIGPPAVRIIEKAQEFDGALIVMSSHGSAGIKRWIVGSVADKVIRSSRRPVLVVPPRDEKLVTH